MDFFFVCFRFSSVGAELVTGMFLVRKFNTEKKVDEAGHFYWGLSRRDAIRQSLLNPQRDYKSDSVTLPEN